jgi:hypothetical protein
MTLRSVRLDPDCGDVLECLRMRDISRSGMGAATSRPFYPGQRVLLNLPRPKGLGRRNVYARVIRCQQSRGEYIIGLEFETASVGAWTGTSSTPVVAAA